MDITTADRALVIDANDTIYCEPGGKWISRLIIDDTRDCIENISVVLVTDGVERTEFEELQHTLAHKVK